MKKDLHPDYVETTVTCTCGNTFTTRSTSASGQIHADVCSQCHPFYTGKQKILDTGGRVARFNQRYGKKADAPPSSSPNRRSRPGFAQVRGRRSRCTRGCMRGSAGSRKEVRGR